jgi:sulfotransferase family protein
VWGVAPFAPSTNQGELLSMVSSASQTAPIFIIGIRARSGTNYFADLLRLHPDCGDSPAPIWEDHLLYDADVVAKYAKSTYSRWHHYVLAAGVDEKLEDELLQSIGSGLITFMTSRVRSKRLVTKTPNVRNLEYFFQLFPHAYLLILVRDGRAVAESAARMHRFRPSLQRYEAAMRQWARGAKTILHFDQATKNSNFQYLIVRYEDLWQNVEGELRRIFDFVGLDATAYDFNAAANIAVRGSSIYRGLGEQRVQWDRPVEKTADFNPLLRWNHWGQELHERFNWIAGAYLEPLGYEAKEYKANPFRWALWNLALDFTWPIRSFITFKPHRFQLALKRVLKSYLGQERIVKIRSLLSMLRSLFRRPSKPLRSDP